MANTVSDSSNNPYQNGTLYSQPFRAGAFRGVTPDPTQPPIQRGILESARLGDEAPDNAVPNTQNPSLPDWRPPSGRAAAAVSDTASRHVVVE